MSSQDSYSANDFPAVEPRSPMGEGARQVMNDVLNYSREVSSFLLQEIKSESRSIAADQLNLASRKLDVFAGALTEAVEKLRESHSDTLADIIEISSKSVMRLSKNLKESDPEKIKGELEDFARRQPGIFLGAAVAAGILLGQIFSSPDEPESATREFHTKKESSIEYRPGNDEEEYHGRH